MIDPINPLKILIHKEKILDAIYNGIPAPITIGLDITNRCNNNCIWCLFKKYRQDHLADISIDAVKKIVPEIASMGTKAICLSGGGEPLVHAQINEIIGIIHDNGIEIGLNTNGCELCEVSDENISKLKYIRISLDAGSHQTHQELHRPSGKTFEDILNELSRIVKLKQKNDLKLIIGIGYLVHSKNHEEIYNLAKKLTEMGVDYLQIRPLKTHQLNDLEALRTYHEIKHARHLNIEIYESISKMQDTIKGINNYHDCYINRLVANIGPDGHVYTCCELRGQHSIGNIHEKTFKEIWQSQRHMDLLNRLDISKCPACKYSKMNEIITRVLIDDEMHREFI